MTFYLFVIHGKNIIFHPKSQIERINFLVDVGFELAPMPFETAIKKSQLDEPAKKILKAQVKQTNMGVKYGVKQKINNGNGSK